MAAVRPTPPRANIESATSPGVGRGQPVPPTPQIGLPCVAMASTLGMGGVPQAPRASLAPVLASVAVSASDAQGTTSPVVTTATTQPSQ